MQRSHVVVLNGPSSAGKSTLAEAVRARVGPTIAVASIDRLFAFMHRDVALTWRAFSALTNALFASVRALADNGYDVIVDTVFERAECLDIMRRALADQAYYLVSVTCPIDTLERRELERGNRPAGLARGQHERVMHGAHYDLQVDTQALSVDECVDRVISLMRQ